VDGIGCVRMTPPFVANLHYLILPHFQLFILSSSFYSSLGHIVYSNIYICITEEGYSLLEFVSRHMQCDYEKEQSPQALLESKHGVGCSPRCGVPVMSSLWASPAPGWFSLSLLPIPSIWPVSSYVYTER
jgi:hypothetical protein